MAEPEVFIAANQAIKVVVDRIKDDQWQMQLPEWFGIGRTQDRKSTTLRTIINYHAFDDAWVPDVLAGKTIAEVGNAYDGDLLRDDPKGNFAKYNTAANDVVRDFTDLDKTVYLSYGEWPAREYLKHITSFRGFRAYEIAKLIGANTKLPDGLVQGLWEELLPEAEEWRKMGVFGPAVAVPEDAPMQDRLLGLSGRDPRA